MRPRSLSRSLIAGLGLASGLVLAAGAARAEILVTPPFPTEGKEATITVFGEGGTALPDLQVEAVYRPGSKVSRTEILGTTREDGRLLWTPDGAGIVTLRTVGDGAPSLSKNLSVRFQGVPLSGLIILIGAGFILYGGVIRGFWLLAGLPPQLPPDT